MINFSNLPITPDSARAARNYCGMNQTQAAEKSGLQAHKLKRFEAGNYVPDTKFLQDLRNFYEGQGYEFSDQPKPGASAIAAGHVLPSGAIIDDQSIPVGKPQSHTVQHVRIDPALSEDVIGSIFDHIEKNEDLISEILGKEVVEGFFGGVSDSSSVAHGQALRLLAENGTLFSKLLGRPVVDAPSPELLSGEKKPQTHAELLSHTQMMMHAAIHGNRDLLVKHKKKNEPKSLTEAIFG